MPALFLGSISTLADTSEIQRESFNKAFQEHGLDWVWEGEDYRSRLTSAGGADRVREYASERGEDVDADAVHATKSTIYQERLRRGGLEVRPGVVEALSQARQEGWRTGFVTTTSRDNVDALLDGLDGTLRAEDFDVVVDVSSVPDRKPAADAYAYALDQVGVPAVEAVAVEDNVPGAESARAAGITTIAFPNANTAGHDWSEVGEVTDRLEFGRLHEAATPA